MEKWRKGKKGVRSPVQPETTKADPHGSAFIYLKTFTGIIQLLELPQQLLPSELPQRQRQ